MKRIFFTVLLLIFSVGGFTIFQYFKFNDGKLHLTFCNVGEGDGIFIKTPKGLDILIDSGPDDSILNCLSKNMPFWDRDLELAILTHPHADHMRGFISVLQRYEVKNFATESLINTTDLYKELINSVRKDGLKVQDLLAGDTFKTSDGFTLKIMGPNKEFLSRTAKGVIKESSEDASLSLLLSLGTFNALLTADAPIDELREETGNMVSKVSVFQIPHHGSKYNSDEQLIKDISPKIAIISVGKNNYGHPASEVLKALDNLKLPYFRTDRNGDIEIIADKDGNFSVR